jgi:hypothetical protein
MSSVDREPEELHEEIEDTSLADQALEAIVRSQQLRERARRLREKALGEAPSEPNV